MSPWWLALPFTPPPPGPPGGKEEAAGDAKPQATLCRGWRDGRVRVSLPRRRGLLQAPSNSLQPRSLPDLPQPGESGPSGRASPTHRPTEALGKSPGLLARGKARLRQLPACALYAWAREADQTCGVLTPRSSEWAPDLGQGGAGAGRRLQRGERREVRGERRSKANCSACSTPQVTFQARDRTTLCLPEREGP